MKNVKRGTLPSQFRYVQRWLILDNRTMAIPDAEDVHDYRPLFALDQNGTRAIATASNDLITNR
jgi:hypothetical protein